MLQATYKDTHIQHKSTQAGVGAAIVADVAAVNVAAAAVASKMPEIIS